MGQIYFCKWIFNFATFKDKIVLILQINNNEAILSQVMDKVLKYILIM
jgi:hypothetical protein